MLAPPIFFFFNDTATTEIYTLSLHDALPICRAIVGPGLFRPAIQISRLEIAIDERCLGHGACKQRSSQCQAPCLGSGLLFESTPLGTDSLSCHTAPLFFDAFAPLKKLCSATVDSPAAFPRSKKERTNPLRGL